MNSLKWSVHLNGNVKIKIEKTKLVLFRNSKDYTLPSNAKVKILIDSIAKSGLPVEVAQAIDKKTISFLIYWELAEFRLFEKGKPVVATNVLFMNFRQQKQKRFALGSQSIIHFEKNIPIIRNCMNNHFVKFFDQKLFSSIISRTADPKKNKYNQFLNNALSEESKYSFEIDFEKLMIERTSIPFHHADLNQDGGKILKSKADILLNFDNSSKPKRSVTRIFSDSEIPFQKISTLFSVIGKGNIWNHSYFGKRIRRPYPSGGGAYEIDFYYISIRSERINPGLYRYNGLKHKLQPIASKEEDLRLITQLSQDSTGERNCRDEEKARAKERFFSIRDKEGRWDPLNQRPEIGETYNSFLGPNQQMRVFPISNWTELDVWSYIAQEEIELPRIYFSHQRKVVKKDQFLIPVTDFTPAMKEDLVATLNVRFRTVGDILCTSPILSTATNAHQVILELLNEKISERGATRRDDKTSKFSMENRKRDGYF